MGSLCRINQSKLRFLSHQFKRHYFQVPYASSFYQSGALKRSSLQENKSWDLCTRLNGFCDHVRFFAAPFQGKFKKEEDDSDGPRLNEKIKAQYVRLVSDEGHTVVSFREALERARKLELDLVEVQRTCDPPVCKIMDFHKEKFKKQAVEKDRAKTKSALSLRKGDCKEVRFTLKIEKKDLKMKADTAIRLMEQGYRVKCMAMPVNNKECEGNDLGELLSRLTALLEDVAIVESGPRVEKKQAFVIIRHTKFGLPKKGGKKIKDVGDIKPPVEKPNSTQQAGEASVDAQSSEQSDKDKDTIEESGLESSPHFPEKVPSAYPERLGKETENRYKKREQGNQFQPPRGPVNLRPPQGSELPTFPGKQPSDGPNVPENRYQKAQRRNPPPPTMDNKGPGTREPFRPQFPQQRQQPQPPQANFSAPRGQARTDHPLPNQPPRQPPFRPNNGNNSSSSFGIFSSQNAKGPEKQDQSDGSQRPGVGQGKYGMFSADSQQNK